MDIGTVNLDISGLSDTALGQVDSAYKCWALVYSGAPSDSGTVFCVHDEHHTVISSAASFLIGRSNDTHDLSMIRTDIQIHEENLGPHLLTLVLDKWITKSGVLLAVNAAILSESAVINERTSLVLAPITDSLIMPLYLHGSCGASGSKMQWPTSRDPSPERGL
ncbi:hypothetical protein PLESTM_001542900 [Pleodorina starrii]|nr:hypothetical protein PLESTM_001542900 [Pleodorina starrii]